MIRTGPSSLFVALLACSATGFAAPPLGLSVGSEGRGESRVTVVMSAATLGENCGAAGPAVAPSNEKSAGKTDSSRSAVARPRCQQSSMQLSITAAAGGAPTLLRVRKVELFDQGGRLISELVARAPTVWAASGSYQPWDERVAPGRTLSVSYALGQPNWGAVKDRANKSYLVRAVISVGEVDQTVQRDVRYEVHVDAPTNLPPDVAT